MTPSILLVTIGAGKPSTRLRIAPLAERLRQRGWRVTTREVANSLGGRLGLLRDAGRHDLVLLQKKLFPAAYVRLLRRANPRLLFDVDDAVMFHELERNEPVTGRFFERYAAIAAASAMVVAGNRYVAEFARAARGRDGQGDVAILPTPIDTTHLTARPAEAGGEGFVVGWIGTKGNLYQLHPLAAALREVQAQVPGFRLRVIADAAPELAGLRIESQPWQYATEAADLHGFDVGIMPLADTLWNRGKGGFKLLQYMAAGLPAIASPVGINADIIRHGDNGFLAADPNAWRDALLALAADAGLRRRIGAAARRTIEGGYSVEHYLDNYVELIERCLK
jgi:glycosyltransferase involved in cell wall biosynthesis